MVAKRTSITTVRDQYLSFATFLTPLFLISHYLQHKKISRCTLMFGVLINYVWSLFLGGSPCCSHRRRHRSHLEHQQLVSPHQAVAPVLCLQVAGLSSPSSRTRLTSTGSWSLRTKLTHRSYVYR
jgi:hypothetical protein